LSKLFSYVVAAVLVLGTTWYLYPASDSEVVQPPVDLHPPSQTSQEPVAATAEGAITTTQSNVRGKQPAPTRHGQNRPKRDTIREVVQNENKSEDVTPSLLEQAQAEPEPNSAYLHDEQQFLNEEADDKWAADSSQHISDSFEQLSSEHENFGSKLNGVECHATMCKVQVAHENARAQQDFFMPFATQMLSQQLSGITFQTEKRQDGSVAEIMYVSKSG
jgi:hypothetical protein